MADISKINAVLIANIAEIDDVLAANIAKVNGLVFTTAPAFTGLLDTYTGAAAAYSTRRLYGQYTGAAMRVREDSGDTETDIGFDANGDLDTAAIATHCGSANGYVTKWYGQESSGGTGSGNDAAQTTSGSQPQIYNGTAVITENGKPAIETDDTPTRMVMGSSVTVHSGFFVYRKTASKILSTLVGTDANGQIDGGGTFSSFTKALNASDGTNITRATTAADNTSQFLGSVHLGTTSSVRINGTQEATGTTSTFSVQGIFQRTNLDGDNRFVFVGRTQEIILYDSAQSGTDIEGIETDINSEYLIYQPTDAPTSGLLATYTGAAAAYSVRQLSDKAVIAMRIRRDSDDAETNIGWDANGDLDTTAISDFCGTANGFVTRWWDQSTNGNHASQGTSASQPQIYNGTAVLTENGKSAIQFQAAGGSSAIHLELTTQQSINTMFSVATAGSNTNFNYITWHNSGADGFYHGAGSSRNLGFYDGGIRVLSGNDDTQALGYFRLNGTKYDVGRDGGAVTLLGGGIGAITIEEIARSNGSNQVEFLQELIVYGSDQSTNRSGIETNINTYFSIY